MDIGSAVGRKQGVSEQQLLDLDQFETSAMPARSRETRPVNHASTGGFESCRTPRTASRPRKRAPSRCPATSPGFASFPALLDSSDARGLVDLSFVRAGADAAEVVQHSSDLLPSAGWAGRERPVRSEFCGLVIAATATASRIGHGICSFQRVPVPWDAPTSPGPFVTTTYAEYLRPSVQNTVVKRLSAL